MRAYVGNAGTDGLYAFAFNFILVRVQSLREPAHIGIKQDCAVVHYFSDPRAVFINTLGVAGEFRAVQKQIVPPLKFRVQPEIFQRVYDRSDKMREI
jgi:hypothetical protein